MDIEGMNNVGGAEDEPSCQNQLSIFFFVEYDSSKFVLSFCFRLPVVNHHNIITSSTSLGTSGDSNLQLHYQPEPRKLRRCPKKSSKPFLSAACKAQMQQRRSRSSSLGFAGISLDRKGEFPEEGSSLSPTQLPGDETRLKMPLVAVTTSKFPNCFPQT